MSKTTKKDFVKVLAGKLDSTQVHAAEVLEAVESAVKESVVEDGDKLVLPGFITVEKKLAAARTARNPQTGKPVEVPEKLRTKAKIKF